MDSNPSSVKFAVAVALLRSKMFSNKQSSTSTTTTAKATTTSSLVPQSDAQRWKKKAKERKQELIRLKQELKELEDGTQHDLFPPSASCKCYFFDNLGQSSHLKARFEDESNRRINEVLHRRFLRQVRLKERRKRSDELVKRGQILELNVDYEIEQLSISVDFLVELCKTANPVGSETSFSNLSHQAVDFILVCLRKFSKENKSGTIEGITNSLITRLVTRMCTPSTRDEHIQHLLRKLGTDSYLGQRTILAVSQRISVLSETLLFMDPFDEAFPNAHNCMFLMVQLIEFLVVDNVKGWMSEEGVEIGVIEEWLRSVSQARKALHMLESRNGVYVVYMDRVAGELAKELTQVSCAGGLDSDLVESLCT